MRRWDGGQAIVLPVATRMQRRHALFLLLAAAGAALALWLLASGEPPPPPAPPDGPPDAPGTPDAATSDASAASLPTGDAMRPHVAVAVVLRERFAAPPTARIVAVDAAAPDATLPLQVIAGVGAPGEPDDGAAGGALVEVAVGAATFLRHANVVVGERTRLVFGGRRIVRGQVLAADGQPAVGAVVWFGESTAAGWREFGVDAEGRYEGDVPAGAGVPFVVRRDGCATQARWLDVGDGAVADARLAPACVLEVRIAAVAEHFGFVRVHVLPTAVVAAGLAQWPFYLQALDDGVAVDAQGRATFVDLPRDAEVGVVVSHPLVARMAPLSVRTKGERTRAIVALPTYATRSVAGVVGDDAGAPVAGAALRVAPAGTATWPRAPRLAPAAAAWRGAFAVASDGDGAFVLGLPDGEASATVQVRAAGHAGRDVALADWPADGRLVLPRWRGGDVGFALAPPQAGMAWTATADLAGGITASLDGDQPWRVSLPQPGRYDFTLTTTFPGQPPMRRELRDVAVTGAVDIAGPDRAGR
jgi:hypothetical protein